VSITIRDIAAKAGVSFKTVSRVLNNESSVKQETKDRVLAIAKDLGYEKNTAARNLASNHNYSIGYIYSNPNAYYVIEFQQGLIKGCHSAGYELLIHPVAADADNIEDELAHLINRSRVAGLILTPPYSEDERVISYLNDKGVPFVSVISSRLQGEGDLQTFYINDYQAAFDIGKHLEQLGHRHAAVLCGEATHASTQQRLLGFQDAFSQQSDSKLHTFSGTYDFESGVENMRKLLRLSDRPSAVFAMNDEIAAGALFAARLEDVKVPGDIAIAGFEDSPFSRQTWPKLTTAHQPNRAIATSAANRLIHLIRKETAALEPLSITPELVIRESTQS